MDIFSGIIYGLVVAFILTLFGFDNIFIKGVSGFSKMEITTSHYYLAFAILGILGEFFKNK